MTGLTEQQQALVNQNGSFAAWACPGAGKTRAMVARFRRRAAAEPRKGIALLSFTNAAIDEVTRRCGDDPRLLRAPHFVGTFDRFINRYLTGPEFIRRNHTVPTFTERWAPAPFASFRTPRMGRTPDVKLDWFDIDGQGQAHLDMGRVKRESPRTANALQAVLTVARPEIEAKATRRYQALLEHGALSCAASRTLAAVWWSEPQTRSRVKALLAARFAEVIVDEAQDCGSNELDLLRLLHEAGVNLVVVADLDQAIYQFRAAVPDQVRKFANSLDAGPTLNGNFRSTPAICKLNQSLRHEHATEDACGPRRHDLAPIRLLPYSRITEVAPAAIVLAKEHNLDEHDLIVLAHRRRDAQTCVGAQTEAPSGDGSILAIARANHCLNDPQQTPKARQEVIAHIEHLLLSLIIDPARAENANVETLCGRLGLTRRWLRSQAALLISAHDPNGAERTQYATEVRKHLTAISWPNNQQPTVVSARFKAPKEDSWRQLQEPASVATLHWNTIHSVKGSEFPGVVLVLPKSLQPDESGHTAIDHWVNGQPGESRRVLYVGASRAQKLLIIACHQSYSGHIGQLLDKHDVPWAT